MTNQFSKTRLSYKYPGTFSLILAALVFYGMISSVQAQPFSEVMLTRIANAGARAVGLIDANDGSPRLFVIRQTGQIEILDTTTNNISPTVFLNIGTLIDDSSSEQGLLGLAFHPEYADNGYFFVHYTRDPPGQNKDRSVISRYQVSSNPDVANPASGTILLEVEQDFSNHNGGDIHFGPDGFLYIAFGDGGSGGDPNNRAQSKSSLLGKMLRIDIDSETTAAEKCGLVGKYGIPADNPFVNTLDSCDEIWSLGLRNPWRFSFDRLTGDMFVGDVGQNLFEEIDFQAAGAAGTNFGWRCYEANEIYNNTPACTGTLTPPILTYSHSNGCSVTGGYRYRGPYLPLNGFYFYADYCNGKIRLANISAGRWDRQLWLDTSLRISSFGEDTSGNLYIIDIGGGIYAISTPVTPSPPPPSPTSSINISATLILLLL